MKAIGEMIVGSKWFMERWDKYHADSRYTDGPIKKMRHIDRLACPDCGTLSERLGHEFSARDGQETGFTQDTIFITRTPDGGYWRGNEPGVVALDSASTDTSRGGAVVKTSKTVYALAVTHLCPKCLHVFPAQWGRPLRGDAS